ncbi:MAG: DUF2807 domain-containing protein [Bacteroidetes bacterium]|nr:DUF2807 domain-containing protein [Bacteroidota bacterium]
MNTIKLSGSLIASLLFSTATFAQSAMNFDKIKIAGSAVVELRQGEVAGITSEDQGANNNIMNFVSTSVDGWLVITGSSDDIIVTANQLNKIDISGSGKLESNGAFNTNEIDLRVTGAGKMDLSLQAKKTNCVISGSGKIELEEL